MPRSREEEDDEVEETEKKRSSRRGPSVPRISITLPVRIRKKIRIAAAKADMDESEWCKTVIVTAATKTIEKFDVEL